MVCVPGCARILIDRDESSGTTTAEGVDLARARKRIHELERELEIVNRKFHRLSPNELWVTDITEHRTTWR